MAKNNAFFHVVLGPRRVRSTNPIPSTDTSRSWTRLRVVPGARNPGGGGGMVGGRDCPRAWRSASVTIRPERGGVVVLGVELGVELGVKVGFAFFSEVGVGLVSVGAAPSLGPEGGVAWVRSRRGGRGRKGRGGGGRERERGGGGRERERGAGRVARKGMA